MNDPARALQALLQPAALGATLFPPNSRYHGVLTATLTTPEGRPVVYLRRRFIPPMESFSLLQEHTVVQGERLDSIAARYLGDPEQFWRICDANGVIRPEALTEVIGTRIRITLPNGVAGASGA